MVVMVVVVEREERQDRLEPLMVDLADLEAAQYLATQTSLGQQQEQDLGASHEHHLLF
jgi:hypothetical protein